MPYHPTDPQVYIDYAKSLISDAAQLLSNTDWLFDHGTRDAELAIDRARLYLRLAALQREVP